MITSLNGLTFNMLADGGLALTLDEILGKISEDLETRGQDGKPRKLTLELDFRMVNGTVRIDPSIGYKMPKYAPPITTGKVTFDANSKKYVVVFNPSVLNVDQKTIDEALDNEAKQREAGEM